MAKKHRYRYSMEVKIKAKNKKALIMELEELIEIAKMPSNCLGCHFGGDSGESLCDGKINHS